jgi:hypothetical protein
MVHDGRRSKSLKSSISSDYGRKLQTCLLRHKWFLSSQPEWHQSTHKAGIIIIIIIYYPTHSENKQSADAQVSPTVVL